MTVDVASSTDTAILHLVDEIHPALIEEGCRLLVLLGAGASWDCASRTLPEIHNEFQPPLVTELFLGRNSFTRILHRYPLAEQAAADIRPALAHGSIALEAFLREELRDSPYEHRQRQYWAIPLYLQDLLFNVCAWDHTSRMGYVEQPDNYDRLINATLQIPEVAFVTLNYDNLLDRRLFVYHPLTELDSYLAPEANWALIKPHGSIDWGRPVLNDLVQEAPTDPFLAQTFASLGEGISLRDEIVLRPQPDIRNVRRGGTHRDGLELYFPALSAPLGEEDELVCPPDHLSYLRELTGHYNLLDVLVIGYSGLDQGVLDLLSRGGRAFRSLAVVSNSIENAQLSAERITARVRVAENVFGDKPALFDQGFSAFVTSGDLDKYIAEIMSRRPS